jgi:hypothetical protein
MKITKTQTKVLEEMKQVINKAKKYDTFESYFKNEIEPNYWSDYTFPDWEIDAHKKRYELALQNIVTKKANTKTFEKLAELGLIEVLQYDEIRQLDLIKVIN